MTDEEKARAVVFDFDVEYDLTPEQREPLIAVITKALAAVRAEEREACAKDCRWAMEMVHTLIEGRLYDLYRGDREAIDKRLAENKSYLRSGKWLIDNPVQSIRTSTE